MSDAPPPSANLIKSDYSEALSDDAPSEQYEWVCHAQKHAILHTYLSRGLPLSYMIAEHMRRLHSAVEITRFCGVTFLII